VADTSYGKACTKQGMGIAAVLPWMYVVLKFLVAFADPPHTAACQGYQSIMAAGNHLLVRSLIVGTHVGPKIQPLQPWVQPQCTHALLNGDPATTSLAHGPETSRR
jgi:hypothetical protein